MLVNPPLPPMPLAPVRRRVERDGPAVTAAPRPDRDGDPEHSDQRGDDPGGHERPPSEPPTAPARGPAKAPAPMSNETGAALLAILAGEKG